MQTKFKRSICQILST